MTARMTWRIFTAILVIGMVAFPFSQGNVFAQEAKPGPASPFDAGVVGEEGVSSKDLGPLFATGGFQAALPAGGDRLVSTQYTDGAMGMAFIGSTYLR